MFLSNETLIVVESAFWSRLNKNLMDHETLSTQQKIAYLETSNFMVNLFFST